VIDAAAYRRLTSLGRMLVDAEHLTAQGLRMLNQVLTEELNNSEEKW
jgi:hypothetical protein